MKDLVYHVRHRTAYRYSGRIDLCHSITHLKPRRQPGLQVLAHHLEISPPPQFRTERFDSFGNPVLQFSIEASHGSLDVTSTLTVRRSEKAPPRPFAGRAWDAANASDRATDDEGELLVDCLLPTTACPRLDAVDAFLREDLHPGLDAMEVASALMGRVFHEFDYVPGATDTSTPLQVVMEMKKGVCQDFAHLMISALRGIGIPTRYVSGYLETMPPPGTEKLQGADATHAWIEVYSKATGWVGFDPTNNCLPGNQHLKICHGRDYFDVQPLKGIFLGSGTQALKVEVDVNRT